MLCASALLGAELLQAREVLRPIADCPTEEAGTTCEVGGLAWYGDASKAPVQRKAKGDRVLKRFLVTGQLNGQPEKPYVLAFSQLRTDYFAQTDRSGPIAYEVASLGSPHLEVRTNRGSLRILSKFGIEPPPHIVVIDERSWLVVARYSSPCIDLSFLRRTGPFWDEGRGVCVSRSTRQELPRSVSGCQKPKRVDACMPYMMPSGFVPAKGTRLELIDENVRDFRTLRLSVNDPDGTYFGGSGWGIRAYRATGTPYLVLHGRCGDCDE
jgi:hypothetical protein